VVNSLKNNRCVIYGIFLYFIFLVTYLIKEGDTMFLLAISAWIFAMIYACTYLKCRALLMVFLVSFFVFLLGGHLVYEYFGMEMKYYLGDEYYFHSNLSLFISLVFLLFGYIFNSSIRFTISEGTFKHKRSKGIITVFNKLKNSSQVTYVKQASRLLFYITFPFWIYTMLDVVSFVLNNSYHAYYVEYQSSAPFAIKSIAAMTPYFFYVFLATMPSKKECKCPAILYLSYAVLSLFTGRRINIIIMFMFMVLYLIFRHYVYGEKEKWVKKKYVISMIIAIPILIIFLYVWNYIRVESTVDNMSIKNMFFSFFQQQGFSSSIIRLGKYYDSSLREDAFYSFFGIIKYFRTNSIFKLIFNPEYGFSYNHNSVAFATLGNSFSNSLSYFVLRTYLSGSGLGTCYIAELYHDFGYVGVAFGNFVYGYVMSKIGKVWNKTKTYNVWLTAIGFAMVESFIKAPRWNFDIFIAYFLDLGMWISFVAVYIVALVFKSLASKNNKVRVDI